jgi:hypothetical protein
MSTSLPSGAGGSPADASAQEVQLRKRQQFLSARLKARLLASCEPDSAQVARAADTLGALTLDAVHGLDAPSRSELLELREIEHALRRLENAGYGRCTQCGEPIEAERLIRHPDAGWCQKCKTAFEVRRGISVTD